MKNELNKFFLSIGKIIDSKKKYSTKIFFACTVFILQKGLTLKNWKKLQEQPQ